MARAGRTGWRTFAAAVFVMGVGLVLASCQSDSTPRTIVVTTTNDGVDARPGDGVCEMTVALGDCSLRAAITESNLGAGWLTTIDVPSGAYPLSSSEADDANASGDLDVIATSGSLTIRAAGPGAEIVAGPADGGIDLWAGTLRLQGIALRGSRGIGVRTRPGTTLDFAQGALIGNDGAGLAVDPGATATILNATLSSNGGLGVNNAGTVAARFATITANGAGGIGGAGSSSLQATIVAKQSAGSDCAGPVSSLGYNIDGDGSCSLTAIGDATAVDPRLAPLDAARLPAHTPQAGSPVVDAVPAAACATTTASDQRGAVRPSGLACDKGAIEVDASLHLLVTTPIDAPDATPGDGICKISSGACSLRAAIDETNRALPSTGHTISLATDVLLSRSGADDTNSQGDLDVTRTVTIRGAGHTLDANQIDRAIHHLGGNLTIDGLTVTHGRLLPTSTLGAGIHNAAGSLSITNSTIVNNSASGTSLRGGGISILTGNVEISGSTINGNTLTGTTTRGGGIALVDGSLKLTNSTLTGNTASTGSALSQQAGNVVVTASTVAQNGTGPINKTAGTLSVKGSILGATSTGSVCTGAINSVGWNLGTDGSCSLTATGDKQHTNALLGGLAANGGATTTMLPAANSPALDAIALGTPGLCDATSVVDQRGAPRPLGAGCDIGAVEGAGAAMPGLSLVVNTDADGPDLAPGDGVCNSGSGGCSLRAAIDETNRATTSNSITIAAGTNPKLTLAGTDDTNAKGDLDVVGHLVIHGGGARIDANGIDRALQHQLGQLELDNVTVTGGKTSASGAGVLNTSGALLVHDSTFSGNNGVSGGNGSAISIAAGVATIDRSTLTGNSSTGTSDGAALGMTGGTVEVRSTTITGNTSPLPSMFTSSQAAGAIFQQAGSLTISRSTITANAAPYALRRAGGTSIAKATILSTTTGALCRESVESAGWNLASDSTCSLTAATDLHPTDPLLGSLAANGGATATMLPAANSLAVDRIPAGTSGLCDSTTPTDQRGSTRPAGSGCEVGAVEGTGAPQVSLHLVVSNGGDALDANAGDGVCDVGGGSCTLRAAIEEANRSSGSDDITISPGINPTITRAGNDDTNVSGDLDVAGFVTIHGNGATITGNGEDRVLHHLAGHLALDHATITNGHAPWISQGTPGGGIASTSGDMSLSAVDIRGNLGHAAGGGLDTTNGLTTVTDSTIRANQVESGDPTVAGGGINVHDGTLVVSRSSLESNTVTKPGSNSYGGGIAATRSVVDIRSSTFVDNSVAGSQSSGGAIYGVGSKVTIRTSTFARNTAAGAWKVPASGAAITSTNGGFATYNGSLTVVASTLSDNDGTSSLSITSTPVTLSGTIVQPRVGSACAGTVTSGGWNVIPDASCGLSAPTDRSATNPLLGLVQANGGPTRTVLPFANSPAIDAIPIGTPGLCDSTSAVDQRGASRPAGGACDIGAVEGHNGRSATPLFLMVGVGPDRADVTPGDGICDDGTGACPLRAAVDEANAYPTADTFELAAGQTYALSQAGGSEDLDATGDLDVMGDLTWHGNSATLSAGQIDRAIDHRGGTLVISDLTVRDGFTTSTFDDGGAGGIKSTGTSLTLQRLHVVANHTAGSAGGLGAANDRTSIVDSEFTGNDAVTGSGGLSLSSRTADVRRITVRQNRATAGGAGGLANAGTLTLTDSVISDNTAGGGEGGGISNKVGTLVVEHSTVANNSAPTGGGISGGTLQLTGSTISGNSAGGSGWLGRGGALASTISHVTASTIAENSGLEAIYSPESFWTTVGGSILTSTSGSICNLAIGSGGWNLAGDTTCGLNGNGDLQSTEPWLGALADNGGPTPTRLPAAGSAALDRIPVGTASLCDTTAATDQRGTARPVGPACDVGSVEGSGPPLPPLNFVVNIAADGPDKVPGDGVCAANSGRCTLRAAITESNASASGATVTIAPGVNPVLTRTGQDEDNNLTGDLDVRRSLVLHGNGQIIDGGAIDRVIDQHSSSLTVDDVEIRNGRVTSDLGGGAGIRTSGGSLTISRSTINQNQAVHDAGARPVSGGGVLVSQSTLEVDRSTFLQNGSPTTGGGIAIQQSPAHITRSTFHHNSSGSGAGLYEEHSTVTVEASTFSANEGTEGAALATNYGGTPDGSLVVTSSTIAANVGQYAISGNKVSLRGTIVAGSATLCHSATTSLGFNIATDASCGLTTTTDRPSTDPLLGALGANGGSTLTHLLLPGSPARDVIALGTTGLCTSGVADQRSVSRPVGSACDVGATEQ